MRCLLILLFLISTQLLANKLITTIHSTSNIEKITIPNGLTYSNFSNTATWTNNFGNYGTAKCVGLIKTNKTDEVTIEVICENSDKKGFKTWTILKRNSLEFDVGVGASEIIYGTGPWKHLVGTKCTYATNYLNNVNFAIDKCDISDKAFKVLSDYN